MNQIQGAFNQKTPYDRAKEWYVEHLPERGFLLDLHLHLQNGLVLSTPEVFALARFIPMDADDDLISDPANFWDEAYCDCLFCWLLVGSLGAALPHIPKGKPWIGYGRKGVLHFRRLSDLMHKSKSSRNANRQKPSEDCPTALDDHAARRRSEGSSAEQAAKEK
jgi:hypothetical protein